MPRKVKSASLKDVAAVDLAVINLRDARDRLRRAGATEALVKTRLALKSAEGAQRHVRRRYYETHGFKALV